MSGEPDQLKGYRKLRGQFRSTPVKNSSEEKEQEPKRRFSLFRSHREGNKRKRSAQPVLPKPGTMPDSPQNGVLDVASTFSASFSRTAAAKKDYDATRQEFLNTENEHAWDAKARNSATEVEKRASDIVWKIREDERENLFGNKASEAIPGPDTLDMGGQFLTNLPRIENKSNLYKIAHRMPKGGHLHIHFNSEFSPLVLLEESDSYVLDTLFVRTTQPILTSGDLAETEIVFNVLPAETEEANPFSLDYLPEFKKEGSKPWMKWTTFKKNLVARADFGITDPDQWVTSKMVLSEDEVYGIKQTTNGIWARFNQGTRAFKGLMNYESIYRWYVGSCIDDMIKENVMYAELRPMLLDKSIPTDDGKGRLDHEAQMIIILEEYEKKRSELEARGELGKFPFCPKIIYCAPRSIPKKMMEREMQDCIKLKLKFGDLICGFDLVGAEDRPNHIGFYRDELLAFQQTCADFGVEIPFFFHAGETLLDRGGSRDTSNSNLYDSAVLNAKRIGHGFSLVKHPELAEEYRNRNICIELCPTSNELLHLCRNIKEHPFPEILALGIPCTLNSDNPSFFRGDGKYSSSVSLEFYQVMVGSTTMSLHGWRQLAEWSLEYSCLSPDEKAEALAIFKSEWNKFCSWVVEEYGPHADSLDIQK